MAAMGTSGTSQRITGNRTSSILAKSAADPMNAAAPMANVARVTGVSSTLGRKEDATAAKKRMLVMTRTNSSADQCIATPPGLGGKGGLPTSASSPSMPTYVVVRYPHLWGVEVNFLR
ncbi:hypothetical protein Dac01nite_07650 [Demequina activiva]|uniref:Uncharacterized protein n=1 Tax=Demequina activiva TaxID=1582364 RepID=A0A919UKS9_9MICO|nr:hypothetical protein Dac01nite_07650 [Demequina activiva]